MAVKRIIGIGNRYVSGDSVGPLTCERLRQMPLPADLDVVDGGLQGLNLLRLLDGAERVVFVDAIEGDGQDQGQAIVVAEAAEVSTISAAGHDHAAGLAYLVRAAPLACRGPLPKMWVVGVAGGPRRRTIDRAARIALKIAIEGAEPNGGQRETGGESPAQNSKAQAVD